MIRCGRAGSDVAVSPAAGVPVSRGVDVALFGRLTFPRRCVSKPMTVNVVMTATAEMLRIVLAMGL